MIVILIVLVCRQGFGEEKFIWKVFPIDEKAILISDDYQMWLLHGLQPNRLTWSEWIWAEEVPQPDPSYFLDIDTWNEKEISIVHSPWEQCEWKEAYRNDTSILQDCEYVIKNNAYKTQVFAKPLQADELWALYKDLGSTVDDLLMRGFYGHAAVLLEKMNVFVKFRNKLISECENKANGRPFDNRYTTFNEINGLFPY